MKSLKEFITEAAGEMWIGPTDSEAFDGMSGEESYQKLVVDDGIKYWEKFGMDTVYDYAEYPEGLSEYSRAAKTSIKSAGKKYAKLLEKLLKPKFLGKSKKSIEDIEEEFMSTDYFKEDAWEWAPGAGTDLLYNYWDYNGFWACLKYYFGEISKEEYDEDTKYYDNKI